MPSSSNATSRVTSPRPCTPRAVLLSACIGDPIELVSKKRNVDATYKTSCLWLRATEIFAWPDQYDRVVLVVAHEGDDVSQGRPYPHLEDVEEIGNSTKEGV
jgi:hypothetical protein